MSYDPRPVLDELGIPWNQVVAPTYGYSGTFTPQYVHPHWTAGGGGALVSAIAGRCYHSGVDRQGVAQLGGYLVRQAHGGQGRTQPIQLARDGNMTAVLIRQWQTNSAPDNTGSWANQFGMSCCIDNLGTGEIPPDVQYRNWVALCAVWLYVLDLGPGCVCDHSSSTARKIDVNPVVPQLDPARWMADIADTLAALRGSTLRPSTRRRRMYQLWQEKRGDSTQNYVSDGINVRWIRTPWDFDNVTTQMRAAGYDTTVNPVERQSITNGELGVLVGDLPPW